MMFLKEALSGLCLAKDAVQRHLDRMRLNDILHEKPELRLSDFFINVEECKQVLEELSSIHGMEKIFHKPIIALAFQMAYFRISFSIEILYGFVTVDNKGIEKPWISSSIKKLKREQRENKPKDNHKSQTERYIYSERGKDILDLGGSVFDKNKSGSYNMVIIHENISKIIIHGCQYDQKPDDQKYQLLYPLFRVLNPERKLCKDENEFKAQDIPVYHNFRAYQIGHVKTLLGVTK
jgi:hypothetical protein